MALNILVVEDGLSQGKTIQATLENEGHRVILSKDGAGLLDLLISEKIDILLLDIVLPAFSGFELLCQVLDCDETRDIPTIMVTGLTSAHVLKKALDMGALDYVKKPVDSIELIARINSAIRLKTKQDQLKEFAIRDKLTGLYNRLYFDEILPKMLNDIQFSESGMSMAMIDCDYFKKINDSFGHVAGDKVLEAVSNVLVKSTKNKDVLCRYGGEEFCLILTDTTLQQGFFIGERIRKNVEKMRVSFGGKQIKVTISIGVIHTDKDENATALELIDRADQALYLAKSNGRNRVEIFGM